MRFPFSKVGLIGGLFLLTGIMVWLYYPITTYQEYLNWDDYVYLLQENVQELSWENCKKYFYTSVNKTYVPLTMLSWMVESSIWGQTPQVHLRINLLIYLFSIWMVAWITWLLFKRKDLSFLTAALFGLHPAHVESVAWITERKDLLYGFFYLLGLGTYSLHAQRKKSGSHWYFLTLIAFLLSLFSKGQAVTLPILLIGIDIMYNRARFSGNYILGRLPFFTLSILFGWLALYYQGLVGYEEETYDAVYKFSGIERIVLAGSAFGRYVQLTIAPIFLNPIVALPLPNKALPFWHYISALSVPLFIVLFWRVVKENRIAAFGLFGFAATIVLMLDHSSVGNVHIADRFLYIPLFGASIAMATGLLRLLEIAPKPMPFLLVAYLLFFAVKTKHQVRVWEDEETLYRYALKLNPESPIALSGYAGLKLNYLQADSAIYFYKKADSLLKEQADVMLNMGKALVLLDQFEEALPYLSLGLQGMRHEEKPEEFYLLAKTLSNTGRGLAALNEMNQLIARVPPQPYFLTLRGSIYLRYFNDLVNSANDFENALKLHPGTAEAWNGLGLVAAIDEDYETALTFMDKSLILNPNNCATYENYKKVLHFMEDEKGIQELRKKAIAAGCD